MSRKSLKLAVVTDGRPGNRVQAEGLARAIARLQAADMRIHDVDVNPFWQTLSLRLTGRGIGTAPDAGIVIGAGRRGNLIAAQARRAGAKAIAILNPAVPLRWFDLIITPEHDGLRGDNVLTTLGSMNAMSQQRIAEAAQGLPPLPAPALTILIGGPSKSADFNVQELIADIAPFAEAGYHLFATPSRRTPDAAIDMLRTSFPRMVIWDGAAPNPYPGWLHLAQAIMVTRDSVNMLSEAAATGLPLYVSGTGRVAEKFTRFHATLQTRGITRPASNGPDHWEYTPLHEADRIAPMVLERLGL